jgi:DNA-directed RNA polymerase subunit RPC12/RpoP
MPMRLLISLSILLIVQLSATDIQTCKSCHPTIYNEFQNSFHKKSTINEDAVHKAVWEKHPAKAKGNYKCAKCHTPNVPKEKQPHQGISCISCHTITDIKEHQTSNSNIYESKDKTLYSAQKGMEDKKIVYKEERSWLGLVKKTTGSPYHDIDYRNKNFYTGRVCMGCHSHKENGKGFKLCETDMRGAVSKKTNCISCHMPQVSGTATTIRQSKTHAFHGFAGVRNAPELLEKYVDIFYQKSNDGFTLTVVNKAPHKLLTHPLRLVQLRTTLKRADKKQSLKTSTFVKIIGTAGKPSAPWLATEIIKDNMIKANEKRVITFDTKLQHGDEIEATLGYYIVNPKSIKKLGLEGDKALQSFITLKHQYFKIK